MNTRHIMCSKCTLHTMHSRSSWTPSGRAIVVIISKQSSVHYLLPVIKKHILFWRECFGIIYVSLLLWPTLTNSHLYNSDTWKANMHQKLNSFRCAEFATFATILYIVHACFRLSYEKTDASISSLFKFLPDTSDRWAS